MEIQSDPSVPIDDYAKNGGPGERSDFYVVFTMSLYAP